jgi:hypothetical protein
MFFQVSIFLWWNRFHMDFNSNVFPSIAKCRA